MSSLKAKTLELIHHDRIDSLPRRVFGTKPNATLSVQLVNPYPDTFQIAIRRTQNYVCVPNRFSHSLRLHLNARQVEHAYYALFEGLYLLSDNVMLSDIGKYVKAAGQAVPTDMWKAVRRHAESHQFDEITITFEWKSVQYRFPLTFQLLVDGKP